MTLTLTPDAELARQSTEKKPIYLVVFDGVPYMFGVIPGASFGTPTFVDPYLLGDGHKLGDVNPTYASTLYANLPTAQTYIQVVSSVSWPSAGTVKIPHPTTPGAYEYARYTSVGTGSGYKQLGGVTRGVDGTTMIGTTVAAGTAISRLATLGDQWTSGGGSVTPRLVMTLKTPSGFGSNVVPAQGQSSVSGGTIPILHSDEFEDVVKNYKPLKNRKVTVYAGLSFQFVDISDCPIVFTGLVRDLTPWDDGLGWDVSVVDLTKELSKEVFLMLEVAESGAINSTASSVPVALDAHISFDDSGYIKIEDEVIKYTSKTSNAFAGCTRGACGTKAAAHEDKATIKEFLVTDKNLHPITLALQVICSTGEGTNGPYDVLPARHGLGISKDLVNITGAENSFQTLIDANPSDKFQFWIERSENAKMWIESQILKPTGSYLVVRGDGKLSARLFSPPVGSATLFQFTDSNVKQAVAAGNYDRQYNRIVWQYDFDASGRSRGQAYYQDDESIEAYGSTWTMTVEAKGIRRTFADGTDTTSLTMMSARSERLLARFAEPPMTVTLEAFFEAFTVEPGDLVYFQSDRILDPRTGARGIGPYVMEVVSRSPNYAAGTMSFELHFTPFTGKRFGKRSPVGMVDYVSATTTQKATYCWVSNDSGKMSNGDDGYVRA